MPILFELGFVILLIVIVVFCARPIVEAYSEKIRTKYKEIGSEQGHQLEKRVTQLEAEILELRQQLRAAQESADFALKFVRGESEDGSDVVIKTTTREAEAKRKS